MTYVALKADFGNIHMWPADELIRSRTRQLVVNSAVDKFTARRAREASAPDDAVDETRTDFAANMARSAFRRTRIEYNHFDQTLFHGVRKLTPKRSEYLLAHVKNLLSAEAKARQTLIAMGMAPTVLNIRKLQAQWGRA